jgi:hypothetical protein
MDPRTPTRPLWLEILGVFWDMRWSFIGCAAMVAAICFAIEHVDVLFPNQRPWTAADTLLTLIFSGMIVWGCFGGLRGRVEKLEATVEELQRKLK